MSGEIQMTRRNLLHSGLALCASATLAPLLAAAADTAPATGAAGAAAAGTLKLGELSVNRLGFGAMRITGERILGPPRDPAEALRVLRRALELGVNFIDTSDAYGPNVSEQLIAQALHPYRRDLVIATKGGFTRSADGAWIPDGRPEHLRSACEGSLQRLKLERIDVYQLHTVDPKVPIEESIGALKRLQQQGKIRHIGVSNVSVAQLARARATATIVSVQNRYNFADRGNDDVLAVCARDGLAFIPWAPLGVEAGPGPRRTQAIPDGAVADIAARHGVGTQQVALAWLLARSPAMLPIPGTSSVVHLEQNVAAAALKLGPQELAQLSG